MSDYREMVREALNTVADKPITDTGGGIGALAGLVDYWVWLGGKEYLVTLTPTARSRDAFEEMTTQRAVQ